MTNCMVTSISIGRVSSIALPSEPTISVPSSMNIGNCSVSTAAISPTAFPIDELICPKSPFALLISLESVEKMSVIAPETSPTVGRKTPSIERFVPSSAELRSSYLISLICDSASYISTVPDSIPARTGRIFDSRSSYIVPNSATAAAFFSMWSSMPSSAFTTSKKASRAESPPAAKRAIISSAFMPSEVKAPIVVSLPSLARMLNSLTASPTLSIENTPASAPPIRPCRNSSADSPKAAYCAEYSLRVSSKSPF